MIGLIPATAAGRTGCARLAAAWPGRTVLYDDGRPLRDTVSRAFAECDQLVLFLATGAAVRLLAPLLADKVTDPGVVTVDEAHRHAVALLGGHAGGANALAAAVSAVLGSGPVVTTATDSSGGLALDSLPYPAEGALPSVTRALLDGTPVLLRKDSTWPLPAFPPTVIPEGTPRPAPPTALSRPPAAAATGEPHSPEHPGTPDDGAASPSAAARGRETAQTGGGATTPAEDGSAPPNTTVPVPPDAADAADAADQGAAPPAEHPHTTGEEAVPPTTAAARGREAAQTGGGATTPAEDGSAPPDTAIPVPPDAADQGAAPPAEHPHTTGEEAVPPTTAAARGREAAQTGGGATTPAEDGSAPPAAAATGEPRSSEPAAPRGRGTARAGAGVQVVWVTDRVVEAETTVFVRPPSLVVGVGGSRGVSREEVVGLVRGALREAGLAVKSVAALATVDAKAEEPGIVGAAAEFGVPLVTYPAEALAEIPVPNPSAAPLAAVGTPSVAEAAALLAAPGGELVVEKRKSAMATVAVARRRPRGRLAVVGLGPGARDLVTPRAVTELRRAAVVVGLDQYVDQIRDLLRPGTRLLESGLGAEEERARTAVAEARAGHAVALIGSGDAGVYAMASPALAEAADDIDVVGVPGVTAALAAAALLGAPLGHDHVSISLSDLHTPWDVIERRVRAAAESDLVVTFYNPRSRGRDWQLPKALSILAEHRTPATPVGVVHAASRPDERVTVTSLAELDVRTVDMVTVVTVGNTASRTVSGRMVTPRGYRWQAAPPTPTAFATPATPGAPAAPHSGGDDT